MRATLAKWQPWAWFAGAVALFWWAVVGLETHSINLRESIPQAVRIFEIMFVEMEWGYTPDLIPAVLETVQMAILGTLLASILAVPFGFLAARNMGKRLSGTGKFLLNAIRVFPELVLAIVFIRGVGPGPLAGILAMGVHSVGMLGKLYGESVESIDPGPSEALVSTGANRIQQVWFAIIPQVLPEFASYAIYRFEINSRAATILGIVGAGGIGSPLIFAILKRDWGRVGIILVAIVIVVTAIDMLSSWLRRKLV